MSPRGPIDVPCRKPLAAAGSPILLPAMALADPKNPNRPLSLSDIRAMIARGEADGGASRVSDLDELLAEWARLGCLATMEPHRLSTAGSRAKRSRPDLPPRAPAGRRTARRFLPGSTRNYTSVSARIAADSRTPHTERRDVRPAVARRPDGML